MKKEITTMKRSRILVTLAAAGFLAGSLTVVNTRAQSQSATSIPNLAQFPDPSGFVSTYTTAGSIDLTNPFFQSLGTNGRSCGSCHVAGDGWTITPPHIQQRFDASGGTDPVFRTNDGSNCDHNIDTSTVAGRQQAYGLLLTRGLIRVAIGVPANAEFQVVNVSNPYGCSDTSTISMYRRPLPSTNLRFLSTVMWDGRESTPPSTQKITFLTNPGDLIADLTHQSVDATLGHAQAIAAPTPQQQQQIVAFEMAMSTAQANVQGAGDLTQGGNGGPQAIASQPFFVGINDPLGQNPFGTPFTPVIFNLYDSFAGQGNSLRASIARGQALFNGKPISITGVAGLNDVLGAPAIAGTCGTCHDTFNTGNHSVSAPLNIGVGDTSNPLGVGYLPVITLQNMATGAVVQTTDPGRAMITGKWADIGKLKGPILRGLASRAPYFHNGSAMSLLDAVTFYDLRFGIGFTAQEKADLVAFLSAL
jgi:hypothetical protein